MKKVIFLLAVFCGFLVSAQSSDDSVVVATDQMMLDYFGNFDNTMTFPDGSESYRQIIMTVKLGQYNCPAGTQYCHQWDYTAQIQLLKNDRVYELGRFMTPFATSGWQRFGSAWEQPYVYDVSDFYPLLQGESEIRLRYDGYSGGFTAIIEFEFISGIPENEVLGIDTAFQVTHATYGGSGNFNDNFPTFTANPPEGTERVGMQVLVSGHGQDDTDGCCEFTSKYYDFKVDGAQQDRIDLWRADCGENDLYPQGGTWIFDRANWCPGAKVEPIYHSFDVTAGNSYDIDIAFQNYTGSGNLGSYIFNGVVFYYGAKNKNLDAALSDIVAPTNDPNHFRANPSGSIPIVKVKNTGDSEITSLTFDYHVGNYASDTYTWSGNIEPGVEARIELPEYNALTSLSLQGLGIDSQFNISITEVNGQEDDDASNNAGSSTFKPAPKWPSTIKLNLKTGSKIDGQYLYNSGPSDISWTITDMHGNVIASKTDALVKTQYEDTVTLPEEGFYKLTIANENCFGLNWWYWQQVVGASYTAGFFKVLNENGTNLPMNDYVYNGTPHDDWGCSYTQYFSSEGGTVSVDKVNQMSVKVFPNPTADYINVDLPENLVGPFKVTLTDLNGRIVTQSVQKVDSIQLPVSQFESGMYMLMLEDAENNKFTEKVLIKNR